MISITSDKDYQLGSKCLAIYFYAEWALCHRKMITVIDKVEKKFPWIPFYAIDIDYFKDLPKQFNVDVLPTVIVFSKIGEEVGRINKVMSTPDFVKVMSQYLDCN